jgi:hypothetical protein
VALAAQAARWEQASSVLVPDATWRFSCWWEGPQPYGDGIAAGGRIETDNTLGSIGITVPFYQAFVGTAIMPGVFAARHLIARRARRLRRPELCRACGYNLHGNISGVCPECGTSAARPGGAGG